MKSILILICVLVLTMPGIQTKAETYSVGIFQPKYNKGKIHRQNSVRNTNKRQKRMLKKNGLAVCEIKNTSFS